MAGPAALRWVRASLLAAVMLAAGCSGHAVAGGSTPPTGLLGPLLVVVTVAVAPFLEGPVSARRVVALVVAAQGALHAVLQVVAGTARGDAGPMVMSSTPNGGMLMHGGAQSASTSMANAGGAHVGMFLAHAGAALVVALWLAAGERAVWGLAAVSSLLVTTTWCAVRTAWRLMPVVTFVVEPVAVPVRVDGRPFRESVWDGHGGPSRRGPPRGCAV